jgi:Spy/CpxP family protein refolding chaperone
MREAHDQRDLERAFAALRRQDEQGAPSFDGLLSAPGTRARTLPLRLGVALAAASLLAALLVGVAVRRPAPSPPIASIEQWTAPTDFLLRTPGRDVLDTVPRIGSGPGGRGPEPAREKKEHVAMKRAWTLAVIALVLGAATARGQHPASSQTPEDPLAPHVFPPELVMRHAADIGLDDKQRAAIKEAVVKTQSRFLDLQWDVQAEAEKMARLLQASPVDEAAVLAQADKVMGLEREVKKAHLSLLVRIKNLLTDSQRAKLTELRKADGGKP